jgi:hypothetical protein
MVLHCYGNPDPALDEDPKVARSNTLQFYKKDSLFFMANNIKTWNSSPMDRNTTKSLEVNDLIKWVKKKGGKKQGMVSISRKALIKKECRIL